MGFRGWGRQGGQAGGRKARVALPRREAPSLGAVTPGPEGHLLEDLDPRTPEQRPRSPGSSSPVPPAGTWLARRQVHRSPCSFTLVALAAGTWAALRAQGRASRAHDQRGTSRVALWVLVAGLAVCPPPSLCSLRMSVPAPALGPGPDVLKETYKA